MLEFLQPILDAPARGRGRRRRRRRAGRRGRDGRRPGRRGLAPRDGGASSTGPGTPTPGPSKTAAGRAAGTMTTTIADEPPSTTPTAGRADAARRPRSTTTRTSGAASARPARGSRSGSLAALTALALVGGLARAAAKRGEEELSAWTRTTGKRAGERSTRFHEGHVNAHLARHASVLDGKRRPRPLVRQDRGHGLPRVTRARGRRRGGVELAVRAFLRRARSRAFGNGRQGMPPLRGRPLSPRRRRRLRHDRGDRRAGGRALRSRRARRCRRRRGGGTPATSARWRRASRPA